MIVDQERLVESLLAFVGERTGLTRQQISEAFEANDLFWEMHRDEMSSVLDRDEDP